MASNIAIESERNGGVRQPVFNEVKNRRKRPFDIIYASNPTPTASEESHLAGHTKQRRKYPKVCGDRTSNRKYDEKSHKRFAITSKRGMKSISQTEEKSIPMLEVIAPYRKCERDRYKKSFEDIEENADWSEADVYVEVADKLLTNRYLEEERKFLERSRKSEEKTKNKWEQLLKSTKKEDDLSPETIAAVIFSEEKGLSLKTVPEVTYQKLFPEDKFTPVVKVVKAGQDKKNAMIPVSLSPADGFLGDEDGAFFESYMKNEFEIPESMPTQVGSRTSQILSGTPNENKDFDIPLEPSVPSRENFVQLRGSVPPKWFPGYIFALPNSSDTIRVDQPYQVFEQGWRAFSPTKSSTPEGIIVVGN